MDAFRRLLRYTRSHTGLISGAVVAMVVYGTASAAIAWLIKPIVDDVLPSQDRLGFVISTLLIAYALKGLGAYFSSYLMDDIGQRVVLQIRDELFGHLLNQSAAFFARRSTGQLLSRINNDVSQVQRAVAVPPHERDAEEVEEAAQVTVDPVARAPVLARAVVHRDLRDPEAAVRREHGDEAVELAVDAHTLEHLGLVRLEAAVHVVQADAGDHCGRPVEDLREHPPRPGVVPPRLPAFGQP